LQNLKTKNKLSISATVDNGLPFYILFPRYKNLISYKKKEKLIAKSFHITKFSSSNWFKFKMGRSYTF